MLLHTINCYIVVSAFVVTDLDTERRMDILIIGRRIDRVDDKEIDNSTYSIFNL